MIFLGQGLVRSRGQKIANFVDGKFETNNEKVILKLKMLGFQVEGEEPKQDNTTPPKAAKKPAARKTRKK